MRFLRRLRRRRVSQLFPVGSTKVLDPSTGLNYEIALLLESSGGSDGPSWYAVMSTRSGHAYRHLTWGEALDRYHDMGGLP